MNLKGIQLPELEKEMGINEMFLQSLFPWYLKRIFQILFTIFIYNFISDCLGVIYNLFENFYFLFPNKFLKIYTTYINIFIEF